MSEHKLSKPGSAVERSFTVNYLSGVGEGLPRATPREPDVDQDALLCFSCIIWARTCQKFTLEYWGCGAYTMIPLVR